MGEDLKEKVRERYAGAARAVRDAGGDCCEPSCCGFDAVAREVDDISSASCCGSSCCGSGSWAPEVDMTGGSYSAEELDELPKTVAAASLGCGNPTALATLSSGEVVLDLGSGGGIDVLLSASQVSPGGKVYGLDITDEMLALARENQREAGIENVEFLKGEIEAVPLPDDHVDVIISNCVINLSSEKEKVVSESYRVLKPGGRFAVTDVVFLDEKARLPAEVTRSVGMWTGCISGALEKSEYEAMLEAAGFEDVSVEVTHT